MLITFRQNNITDKLVLHNFCGLKKTSKICIKKLLKLIYHEILKKSIYNIFFLK